MPHLDSQYYISQIFWLIIIFALIYFFVKNYFLPNIEKSVVGRSEKIKLDVELANEAVEQHKKLEVEMKEILIDARHKAFKISTDAMKSAEYDIHEQSVKIEKEIQTKIHLKEEKLARINIEMHKDIDKIVEVLKVEILNNILEHSKPIKTNK